MTIDNVTIDLVRAWLDAAERPSADRVVEAVLSQLDTEPQLRPLVRARPGLRGPLRARSLLATAAVIVVAVVGVASLTLRPTGKPAASASAPPSPTPSSTSSPSGPTPDPAGDVPITTGTYTISTARSSVQFSMPPGWKAPPSSATYVFKPPRQGVRSEVGLEVIPYQITHVVRDVCANDGNVAMDPIGPTAEDLTAALTTQVGVDRKGPDFVSVGRYPARKFEVRIRPECGTQADGFFTDAALTYAFALDPGDTGLVYVINVEDVPLVITASLGPAASSADRSELEAIISSAQVDPVPNPPPLPDIGGGGWLPGGRHRLTVDGTALTFTVPKLVKDRGWNRYGQLSITFDSHGSQSAEAMVYWTAFPDGASTNTCPMITLPRDGSIADLASVIASIDGIRRLEDPRYATVGGYPARYLSFRVDEDNGCDPNFLFASDPPGGGPGWWRTDVGDTLRVWIVDINGKRMFVVGELKQDAEDWLQRDLGDIVASISFG